MNPPPGYPGAIRTDDSNSFANNTMKVRVPRIIREVQEANPDYAPVIQDALNRLHDEIAGNARIPMLEMPAPDYDLWAQAYHPHQGKGWHETGWFFAEVYFYRLLMQAVRWYETHRDPFAQTKALELSSPALWELLNETLSTRTQPLEERLPALLLQVLWGNRIDLSYAASREHGTLSTDDDLLVGDQDAVAEHLLRKKGAVHIIHDNAGTELAMDLALADALLDGAAESVTLHLKMHPTFVSDATLDDLQHFIRILLSGQHGAECGALGQRLQAAFDARRLRFAPDFYWNSTGLLWEMPPSLCNVFRGASLVIVKGDANYRRVVGDGFWPSETPLAQVVEGFPAPLLLLRTLKSDPLVGLQPGVAAHLDTVDARWRHNGRRGVAQAVLW